jgi:hypothetical protein
MVRLPGFYWVQTEYYAADLAEPMVMTPFPFSDSGAIVLFLHLSGDIKKKIV